jgi:NTP pyrophosphatase (non-canonical NTP hydrolase)
MDTSLSLKPVTNILAFWEHVQHRKNHKIQHWQHYANVKLMIETGEAIDPIIKHIFHDKPIQTEKVMEELGDMLFYIASLAKYEDFEVTILLNHRLKTEESWRADTQRVLAACTMLTMNWMDHAAAYSVCIRALSELIYMFGWDFEEVFNYNMRKLEARHGRDFNPNYYLNAGNSEEAPTS